MPASPSKNAPVKTREKECGSELSAVALDFGIDLNAFYDRQGLKFFHGSAAGRTVFSGESPDVVCHELGHAVLDSLKPQLFDAPNIPAGYLAEGQRLNSRQQCCCQAQYPRTLGRLMATSCYEPSLWPCLPRAPGNGFRTPELIRFVPLSSRH
jgi:hypothetical protein